jgi:hypothetical protein
VFAPDDFGDFSCPDVELELCVRSCWAL